MSCNQALGPSTPLLFLPVSFTHFYRPPLSLISTDAPSHPERMGAEAGRAYSWDASAAAANVAAAAFSRWCRQVAASPAEAEVWVHGQARARDFPAGGDG